MQSIEYPRWLYHKEKEPFICQSQAFRDSLEDGDDYELEPFTGPRSVTDTKIKPCKTCNKLKIDIKKLELHNNELEILIEEYKIRLSELKSKSIASTPTTSPVKLTQSDKMKKIWADKKARDKSKETSKETSKEKVIKLDLLK